MNKERKLKTIKKSPVNWNKSFKLKKNPVKWRNYWKKEKRKTFLPLETFSLAEKGLNYFKSARAVDINIFGQTISLRSLFCSSTALYIYISHKFKSIQWKSFPQISSILIRENLNGFWQNFKSELLQVFLSL